MKIRVIVFIILLILLALALAEGLVLVLRLFFLSVLVLLTSYLWALFGVRGIIAQVSKPPDDCQVGEWFEEEVTVFNRSKLPKLLLKVTENSNLPEHNNTSVFNLPPGDSHHWLTRVYCRRRGQYSLGSITVTAADPFGFFSRHRTLGEPQNILVYPATVELPFFESSSLSAFGYGSGYRSFSQISPNASTVREYTTGDSLNHIHWHSTAHTSKLMVKVFDADRSHSGSETVWIIIDMQQSAHLGEGAEATEEYGITIAASLAKKYLDSGMLVGLIASGDQPYLFPPKRGEQHFWHIMEALALMKATGKAPIDQLVSHNMEHIKGDSTTIVITPSGSERVTAAIQQLKNHGHLTVAVLLEPTSFGGATNSLNTIHSLSASGVQVYTVSKGDELARALDNRISSPRTRYI